MPYPFVAQQQLTAAELNALFTWQSWTPTWTANGSVITLTGSWGRYVQAGKTVMAQFSLSANSTATAGTDWTISLPVAARVGSATPPLLPIGNGAVTVSNAAWYPGIMVAPATVPSNVLAKMFRPINSNYVSGAVAVGDQWVGTLAYEAA